MLFSVRLGNGAIVKGISIDEAILGIEAVIAGIGRPSNVPTMVFWPLQKSPRIYHP